MKMDVGGANVRGNTPVFIKGDFPFGDTSIILSLLFIECQKR